MAGKLSPEHLKRMEGSGSESNEDSAISNEDSSRSEKLCGFLKAEIGKYFKTVWVVYMENTGSLMYYVNPKNRGTSSGHLNIARATFILETEGKDKSGLFLISTPEKSVYFEAKDQNAALFWLQELQKKRRLLSLMKTAYLKMHGVNFYKHHTSSESGLLKKIVEIKPDENPKNLYEIPVPIPDDTGEDALRNSSQSPTLKLFSNFRSHLSNFLSSKTPEQNPSDCLVEFRQTLSPNKLRRSFRRSLPFAIRSKDMDQLSTSEDSPREIDNSTFFVSIEKEKDVSELETELAMLRDKVADQELENKKLTGLVSYYRKQLDEALCQNASLMKSHKLTDEREFLTLVSAKDSELAVANEMIRKLEEKSEEICHQNIIMREHCSRLDKINPRKSLSESGLHVCDDQSWTFVDLKSLETIEIEKVKELLTLMRVQKQFSKSELLLINDLRMDLEFREEFYRKGYTDFYAKYLTIQSKLLCVLNEYHIPETADNLNVAYALLDAFKDPEAPDYFNIAKIVGDSSPFDVYGFQKSSTYSQSYGQLATILKCRAQTIETHFMHDPYTDTWISKWECFMATFEDSNFQMTYDVKLLVRTGIPFVYRGRIWKCMIHHHVKLIRNSKPVNYYESLLSQKPDLKNSTDKQIMMDLTRTFPHNKYFENSGIGIPKLRRVLLAFGHHNKTVGYCQGMNRLAAVALLFLSEENAFWFMVAIVEVLLPWNYYSNSLFGVQVDLLVLKELLAEKVERLSSHFNGNNTDPGLYIYQWFVCLFVEVVPVDMFLNIWDTLLFEGDKVLFRYALTFLKMNEYNFIQANGDCDIISQVLKEMKMKLVSWQDVTKVAFGDLNPFSRKMILSKRQHHYPIVQEILTKRNNDLSNWESAMSQSYEQQHYRS